jgi:hypothetical protein
VTCLWCERPVAYARCECDEYCGSSHCWVRPKDALDVGLALDESARDRYGMPLLWRGVLDQWKTKS